MPRGRPRSRASALAALGQPARSGQAGLGGAQSPRAQAPRVAPVPQPAPEPPAAPTPQRRGLLPRRARRSAQAAGSPGPPVEPARPARLAFPRGPSAWGGAAAPAAAVPRPRRSVSAARGLVRPLATLSWSLPSLPIPNRRPPRDARPLPHRGSLLPRAYRRSGRPPLRPRPPRHEPPWRPSRVGAVPASAGPAPAVPGGSHPACRYGATPASVRRGCRQGDRDCVPALCAARIVARRSPRASSTHSSPRCRVPYGASP